MRPADIISRIVGMGLAQNSMTQLDIPFFPALTTIGLRFSTPPAAPGYIGGLFYGAIMSPEVVVPGAFTVILEHLNISRHGPITLTSAYTEQGFWGFFAYVSSENSIDVAFRNTLGINLPFIGFFYHINIRTVEELGLIVKFMLEATAPELGKWALEQNLISYLPKAKL